MMKELGQHEKQAEKHTPKGTQKKAINTRFSTTQMNQNKQNANDILDGYLMTQDNIGNNSGLNLQKNPGSGNMASAINGNSYDDNCLPDLNNHDISKAALNKTNISMISAQSMSQLSNQNVRNGGPGLTNKKTK